MVTSLRLPVISNFLERSLPDFSIRKHWPWLGVSLGVVFAAVLGWLRHDLLTIWYGGQLWSQRQQLQAVATNLGQLGNDTSPAVNVETVSDQLQPLVTLATRAQFHLERSHLLRWKIDPNLTKPLITDAAPLLNLLEQLGSGQHRVVVILQNSDELRATGGFMGSLADIQLQDGQMTENRIYDIYEPAGQFDDFIEAPPGVSEYLSSGQGLRLPDANWHPDFPSSATDILHFLALAGWHDIDLVVAINTQAVESILKVTGPVYIPDYDVTITADNLATVARADRLTFFPGSKAKANLLNAVLTQLKLKLTNLSPSQQVALLKLWPTQVAAHNLLAYSPQDELNQPLEELNLTGRLPITDQNKWLLYPVESNVGINKANQGLKRQWELELGEYRSRLTITFTNTNSRDPLEPANADYIDYQRLVVSPEMSITNLSIDGRDQDQWSDRSLPSLTHQLYREFGWLVEVPAGQTTTVTIELTHPRLTSTTQLLLPKQPGLATTPLTVQFDSEHINSLVDRDVVIQTSPLQF